MNEILFQTVWYGDPRSKKNSQQILRTKSGRAFIAPSKAYKAYEKLCTMQQPRPPRPIDEPVNVKCTYYMKTRRKVDTCNLIEASLDILVHLGVLADDNCNIVVGNDFSRVHYDKVDPRVEIEIRRLTNE